MKPAQKKSESPLSLRRITEAFAQMLGRPASAASAEVEPNGAPGGDSCPVCPKSIVEAILFVGRPDGESFTVDELARTMRDVTHAEVEEAIRELNHTYGVEGAPYQISATAVGYRLELREEFRRLAHRMHGKVREATLSPQVLEVLAVVAYRQPVTAAEIEELRGGKCGTALALLVRRGLLRLERTIDKPAEKRYITTDRFLRLFGLASRSQLPNAEEFGFAGE